ncbi:Uncharacterized protein OBRU01_22569 [Operophtera brumata]|nr:Uncharacterized protein OBRU01_22569 [Operophtera brumata]
MEKYGFGLSRKEVLEMVGDYVNKNKLITPFKHGIPGKDWFVAFKKRHALSVKKPQAVEYARKKAVDPFIIFPYFDLLEKTICDLNLQNKPSAIWNLDETSFSNDPSKTKIVGAKGHASTRVISSPGRDNTTVLLGASASGKKAPPLIVFKGKNVWCEIDPQVLRNGFRKAGIYPVNREEIKEEKFDMLKLRHWEEIKSGRHISTKEQKDTERNPNTLLTIALNLLNITLKQETLNREKLMIPVEPKISNEPRTTKMDISIQDQQTSFEELLLQKLKRGDNLPKPPRRKVAPGAEVITHDDVLERKKKEVKEKLIPKKNIKQEKLIPKKNIKQEKLIPKNIKQEKKNAQQKMSDKLNANQKQARTQDDVVHLRHISKNDIQLQRFVVKDFNDLPHCLHRQESDKNKIKILSNVVIKKADTDKDKKKEGRKDNNKENNYIYTNPKPGPSGLCKTGLKRRRSHSSTSVSGSISSHSDSDILDIIESDASIIDDDEYNNDSAHILNKENIHRNILITDEDNEKIEIPIYNVGDNVMLRYYTRQKWTYYVGIVENIKLIDTEFCYSIKFYKTIKKPKLIFKMTKTCDHDDVSEIQIVKKIALTQDPNAPNNFFMCSDENLIYFEN